MIPKPELLEALYEVANLNDTDLVADACHQLDRLGISFRAQNIIFHAASDGRPFPHAEIAHCIANKKFFT